MAMRWLEGFEIEADEPYFDRSYATRTGTISSIITGREQGSAVVANGTTDLELTTPTLVGAVENTWYFGFGFQATEASGLDTGLTTFPGITVRSGSNDQMTIDFIDANTDAGNFVKIRARRGSTTLGTTTLALSPQLWYYIEVKVVVRTSTNGSVEIKVGRQNEATTQWLNLTGINTANSGADGADNFRIRWSNSGSRAVAFDDIYIFDSTGSTNNNYAGPLSLVGYIPSGTGTTQQWTLDGTAASIADAWDDPVATQTTTDDDKRLTSDIVGQIALAAYPNSTFLHASSPVVGVMFRTTMGMDSTGSRTIVHRLRDTGTLTETDGTSSFVISTTGYTTKYEIFETNPNTTAAWNRSTLDGLEAGVRMTA